MLLVDADAAGVAGMLPALGAAGCDVDTAVNAEAALKRLANGAPDVIVTDVELPARDGAWLLGQVIEQHGEGAPRRIVVTRGPAVKTRLGELGLDALVLKPADLEAVVAAVTGKGAPEPLEETEVLRELVTLSLLSGSDLDEALRVLARQLRDAFLVAECLVVAVTGDRQVVATAGSTAGQEPDARLLERCGVALKVGVPVLAPAGEAGFRSYLAAPIDGSDGSRVAAVMLCDDGLRLYPRFVREALRVLARRISGELAWRSVHERIARDRDRMRALSLLDPMLGVWNRTALARELPAEVAHCLRRKEPMSVAVIDVVGLRHINERFGHVAGDAALRHLAGLTRRALRGQDMVARYAGDSLAVVLSGTPMPKALSIVERLQADLAGSPFKHAAQAIPFQVLAGLAAVGTDHDSGEAALSRAANALALAKRKKLPLAVADESIAKDHALAHPGLEAGATIGGVYHILHEISRGAFGVVYRAEDLGLGRAVALKTLRPDLARDRVFVDRFRAEASTLASIRHDNLVQVYTFGIDGEDVYFVMELVEGEPLEDRISRAADSGRDVPLADVARFVAETAAALEAVHKSGVLHRDVKPANVLIDRARDRHVLVDVGIAVRRGGDKDRAGTPGYTAPETFAGVEETPASDVYGLAACAYTLLTLHQPFGEDPNPWQILRRQRQPPTPPSRHRKDLPPAVDSVLLRALDPEPAKRFDSAGAFADALGAVLGSPRAAPPRTLDRLPEDQTRLMWGATLEPPVRGGAGGLSSTGRPARRGTFRTGETPALDAPHTRGVLFRSAYRVLGARRSQSWVGDASRKSVALAEALRPETSPLSWHPTSAFSQMLDSLVEAGLDATALARELGRVATSGTFDLFFGADAALLDPGKVLGAADLYWRCYHTWGALTISQEGPGARELLLTGPIRDPLVCAATTGILEQVTVFSGGLDVTVDHRACAAAGADACAFVVRWRGEDGPS